MTDTPLSTALPGTLAEIREALRRDAYFQVERAGVLYDIGVGEGGEFVGAWRASDPEDAKSVKRFGETSPWTGKPLPWVAERIVAWIAETDAMAGAPVLAVDPSRSTPNTNPT